MKEFYGRINGSIFAAIIMLLFNNLSIAGPILTEPCPPSGNTCLTGVLGVEIENNLYDVDFEYKSFNDLNALEAFPMFGDETWAVSAANALNFLLDAGLTPSNVVGLNTINEPIIASWFLIPTAFKAGTSESGVNAVVSNAITIGDWQVLPLSPDGEVSTTSELMYATFTKVTAVPEPGTLALFGVGLAVFGFFRRRSLV